MHWRAQGPFLRRPCGDDKGLPDCKIARRKCIGVHRVPFQGDPAETGKWYGENTDHKQKR
jgi:hypothetical protein